MQRILIITTSLIIAAVAAWGVWQHVVMWRFIRLLPLIALLACSGCSS